MGRELISSDGIAFYELVKNGLDAGAATVNIIFDLPIHSEQWDRVHSELVMALAAPQTAGSLQQLKNDAHNALDRSIVRSNEVARALTDATTHHELLEAFRRANRIVVRDRGHGMSADDLETVFLTIGTPMRRVQRERALKDNTGKVPLGEKGIGRLSAMRLGSLLTVESGRTGESSWNVLGLDWNEFERRGDEPLEEIIVEPAVGAKKDRTEQGTSLDIRGLRRAWSMVQVEDILKQDVRRLADPFVKRAQPIATIERNGQLLPMSLPEGWLLTLAHATVSAEYVTDPIPELSYTFRYSLGGADAEARGVLGLTELITQEGRRIPEGVLRRIGPFAVDAYWWNRKQIRKIDTIGTTQQIRNAIREWAGGLSIYRDGFRVNPYGAPDNDWLSLDTKAFGSGGYKLNRQQIIGRVRISARTNPFLVDQTNREGIQDSPEFDAFAGILQSLLLVDFKTFLEQSEQPTSTEETTDQAIRRLRDSVGTVEARLRKRVASLSKERRTWLKSVGLEGDIEITLKLCNEQLETMRHLRDRERASRKQLLPAAGMGLMLDVVVHELNRSTTLAFESAQNVLRARDPVRREEFVGQLRDELKTLRTRLSVIDDFAPSGRQRRERFDAVRWLRDVVAYWEPRFQEKGFVLRLDLLPEGLHQYEVQAVRGMLVQLVGNLLHNSLFWLGIGRSMGKTPSKECVVTLDSAQNRLVIWDDGPGVAAADRTRVFQLGFSRKSAGEGKGLGLYIGAEIARYHKTKLQLVEDQQLSEARLNAFELNLKPIRQQ
jgi:signal transduction histidine kinase